MKHRAVSLALAVTCVLGIGAVAWWSFQQRTSPGPLHASHASVKALKGNAGCDACHGAGDIVQTQSLAPTCNKCHEPIATQIASSTGLHGKMAFHDRNACEECHREHIGDTIGLVAPASFASAGIPDMNVYDHAHVGGLSLEGKHKTLGCQACHKNAAKPSLDEHERRYLGLTQSCTPCHDDFHKGELGPDCNKCHGQERTFKEAPLFAHPKTFELTKGHANLKCSQCHMQSGVFTRLAVTCVSCHQNDYDKTTKPSHAVATMNTDCASCHSTDTWTTSTFNHAETFQLLGAHKQLECTACHTAGQLQAEVVAFGKGDSCAACHTDTYDRTENPPHKVSRINTDCAKCHSVDNWTTTTFEHPKTLPLIGAHKPLKCADCHNDGTKQTQVAIFEQSQSCQACHESRHDHNFVTHALIAQRNVPDACIVCHAAGDATWSKSIDRVTPVLHAGSGFMLDPPHDKQKCTDCHKGIGDEAAKVVTSASWLALFPGRSPDSCEKCHADPHNGQFEKSATGSACISCHDHAAFVPNTFDSSHHAKCAFPLEGSHKAVACVSCHKVEHEVRTFTGTPQDCASCHKDVHDGKFDAPELPAITEGKSGCARCHDSNDFQRVTWNAESHRLWTGENLTGKHAFATCNDCHRRETARANQPIAFKPAPKACADCHADVHAGQFRVEGTTHCATCHESTEMFKTVTFDHQKNSRFALDAEHAKLACASCHRPVDVGGKSVVRYKPLGTQCADCHDPRTQGGSP